MLGLTEECLQTAYLLAFRAAVKNCERLCKLPSERCRQLAEEAVAIAALERARQSFPDCQSYLTQLIYFARFRVIDECRQAKRVTPGYPEDEEGDWHKVRSIESVENVTLDEIPAELLQKLDACLSRMEPLDQRIYRLVLENKMKLDRITDVLRLVHADPILWDELGYGEIDFAKPTHRVFQAFRKRLNRLNAQLKACLKMSY